MECVLHNGWIGEGSATDSTWSDELSLETNEECNEENAALRCSLTFSCSTAAEKLGSGQPARREVVLVTWVAEETGEGSIDGRGQKALLGFMFLF